MLWLHDVQTRLLPIAFAISAPRRILRVEYKLGVGSTHDNLGQIVCDLRVFRPFEGEVLLEGHRVLLQDLASR